MLISLMLRDEALRVAVEFRSVERILPAPVLRPNTAPIDGDAGLPPSLEYIGRR